ncbi:MAG: 3-phosphoshikimate 1-carboxyvinyltransferase [Propionibacteriales bacterium]|nr:3-phosphoshikimate 1-carboxyvinyltransferase [Propionibacteriales bacterium]
MSTWSAPVAAGPITGTVQVPGSKSASARALVVAALADGPSALRGVLDSRDTTLMRTGLVGLGATIGELPDRLQVSPITDVRGGGTIDVGLAGTVMRFLPPIAALAAPGTRFVGDPAAAQRPVGPLLDALSGLGARIDRRAIPFEVAGGPMVVGGTVTVDASASSQFVSALLLAAPRYRDGLRITLTSATVPSRPHIDMTCTMLARHGVRISQPDQLTWLVEPGPIRASDEVVEPDLTNAATLLAAAMVTGGELTTAWPTDSVQAADQLAGVLAAFGARLRYADSADGRTLTVAADGVHGAAVDLHEVSELTPVAAALAAVADGPSTISGVAHIRGHETDRLAALAHELGRIGVGVQETADGLQITPAARTAGVFTTYADHRMAHAGALIGLVTPGIELDDVSCTTKTLPDFERLWTTMVGGQQ